MNVYGKAPVNQIDANRAGIAARGIFMLENRFGKSGWAVDPTGGRSDGIRPSNVVFKPTSGVFVNEEPFGEAVSPLGFGMA